MHDQLNLEISEIPQLRKTLYQEYGTTIRGLQATRSIDERAFIDYVHDVPLDHYLAPDPLLRNVLLRYPQKKIVFTNADRTHAKRVIHALQIADCFQNMIDIFDISPYCKPMPEAFEIALRISGETDPGQCVFIDDSPRNLIAARSLGFFTIQVGSPKPGYQHPESQAHACINQLCDLPQVLDPQLDFS